MKFYKKILKPIIEQIIVYIKRPLSLFDNWAAKGRLNWMPDKWYLSFMFRSRMGYWMNWKNPKTFNEKLQWLKVYDRNPLYTKLVDKYEVRKYIAEKIGEEYLIPLLGVWDNVEDIDFEKLPNQFVLKTNHDSGSVFICTDKKHFNTKEVKEKISNQLKSNYYFFWRETPYKNIKPKIIAEQFLVDESKTELKDYKFFCFDGVPKFLFVATDRNIKQTKFDFFDTKFEHLPIQQHYPNNTSKNFHKPKGFDKMLNLSKILTKSFKHCRADFYDINGKIYFGELTFYHFAGIEKFSPFEWDEKIGNLINL